MPRFLIYLWVLPNTLLGLMYALVGILTGGKASIKDGVLEVYGGLLGGLLWLPCPGYVPAMCLGHVILSASGDTLDLWRDHERVHVRQYEKYGPFFIPYYFYDSFLCVINSIDPYEFNRFEMEAYLESDPRKNGDKP